MSADNLSRFQWTDADRRLKKENGRRKEETNEARFQTYELHHQRHPEIKRLNKNLILKEDSQDLKTQEI